MTDRNRQGVGSIGRLRRMLQVQKAHDHLLDLMLLSPAVTDDRGLNRQRRVLSDRQTHGRGGQHGNSTHLSELDG